MGAAAAAYVPSGSRGPESDSSLLARALEPFPAPVRTLDALHLASADFLRRRGQPIELATYGERLLAAARALDFPIAPV